MVFRATISSDQLAVLNTSHHPQPATLGKLWLGLAETEVEMHDVGIKLPVEAVGEAVGIEHLNLAPMFTAEPIIHFELIAA